jgi:hypothetical protein
MRINLTGRVLLLMTLASIMLTGNAASQTAIVNARPIADAGKLSLEYAGDVDSGLMEYLFDHGYIIFSQSTADPVEKLISVGKETGADIIITWSMDAAGLSGALINCRSGSQSPSRGVSLDDFENVYGNRHDMYEAMGARLCETLISDAGN